jgi:hypothetical protein
VEALWITPSEEIQEGAISREDDGFNCFVIGGNHNWLSVSMQTNWDVCVKKMRVKEGANWLLHGDVQAHTSQVAMATETDWMCGY